MDKDLMQETLDTANDYLYEIINSLDVFSRLIGKGEWEKAVQLFSQIIDAFEWIVNAYSHTYPIHKGVISIEELNEKLPELLDAFQNNDYVLMNDILSYEIKPVLTKWSNECS